MTNLQPSVSYSPVYRLQIVYGLVGALSIGMVILRFQVAGMAWLVLRFFQPIWESTSRARDLLAYLGIK